MENKIEKHEYLREEDYYESRSIQKGRTDKYCEGCHKTIPKGMPHLMHHFYPEFDAYATHVECEQIFKDSLITEDDEQT